MGGVIVQGDMKGDNSSCNKTIPSRTEQLPETSCSPELGRTGGREDGRVMDVVYALYRGY